MAQRRRRTHPSTPEEFNPNTWNIFGSAAARVGRTGLDDAGDRYLDRTKSTRLVFYKYAIEE